MHRRVSILIDNHNYGRFLRQAIDSALAQTYPHREVIVVDDGSTDDSQEIIRSYGDKIRPIFKENGGMASAFNAGLPAATGEIVAFLDADDYLLPGALERIVAAWAPGTKAVHHRLRRVDAEGRTLGEEPPRSVPLDAGDVLAIQLRRGFYGAPPTSGLAYDRALAQSLLPIPEQAFRRCAESYFVFAVPFYAQVQVVEGPLACYRVHDSNDYGRPRRRWDRDRLRRGLENAELQRSFIRRLATERGLAVPPSEAWEEGAQLFQQFLYLCSAPGPRPGRDGFARIGKMIRQLRRDGTNWPIVVRLALLALLVWRGPLFLRRRVYPNLFKPDPA
jgi:glycosyltransferase involved in cell wall biosynthesis